MISASIMCGDALNLGDDIAALRQCGAEYLHCDIMDGHFVPNLMLSTAQIAAFKAESGMKLDIHMMTEQPENKLAWFAVSSGDLVSIHYESTPHVHRAIEMVKKTGATAALALNPSTPLGCALELLPDIGMLLVMTVNPGYASQVCVPQTIEKIRRARCMLDDRGYGDIWIEADGNCSFRNIGRMSQAGANVFVLGSSSLFDKTNTIAYNAQKARALMV